MSRPEPGRVLRLALVAWGLGHLAIGRTLTGRILLAAELGAALTVAWLTAGLADTNLYLVPFLAGVAFLVAWTWQAVAAYHAAHDLAGARPPAPERSPAAAIGWLSLPLLLWGTGFWVIGAQSATPAGVLDRFMSAWTDGELDAEGWPSHLVAASSQAAASLRAGEGAFRDLRVRVVREDADGATAVAEIVHFERRASRFLGIFEGSELMPVVDSRLLTLELAARPAELPGGGDIGAVRWELVDAEAS